MPAVNDSRAGAALGGAMLSTVITLALMMPCTGFSQEPPARLEPPSSLSPEAAAAALPPTSTEPKLSWETGTGKNYLLPAVEILGFDFLLNRVQHVLRLLLLQTSQVDDRRNLRSSWGTDSDPFQTNQLGHPYQGSMYHGFARSAGLSYWESLGYTFAGSAMWEIAGESTPPSKNDQIASGIGGTFLGEALFRMANLVLENATDTPRFWRETSAAIISPSTGFNRLAFGERYDSIFSSRGAAYYSRFAFAMSAATHNVPVLRKAGRHEALADFSSIGLPVKPEYTTSGHSIFAFQAMPRARTCSKTS